MANPRKVQISKSNRSNPEAGKAFNKFREKGISNHHESKDIGLNEPINQSSLSNTGIAEVEQSDRSLTVMIPRARYFHPTVLPNRQAQLTQHQMSRSPDDQAIDKSKPKRSQSHQNGTYNDININTRYIGPTTTVGDSESLQKGGSLVSAGFEVSAIVSDRGTESNNMALPLNVTPKSLVTLSPEEQQRQQQISRSKSKLEAILRSGE